MRWHYATFCSTPDYFLLVETDGGQSGEKLKPKWGTVAQLKKILLVGFVVFCAEYATATPREVVESISNVHENISMLVELKFTVFPEVPTFL